ncbi:11591_t:CDS:2, partial [Ambispora leptoticha]
MTSVSYLVAVISSTEIIIKSKDGPIKPVCVARRTTVLAVLKSTDNHRWYHWCVNNYGYFDVKEINPIIKKLENGGDENGKQKEVNRPLIQFLGNNIYGGNNGTLNIESRKRKSTGIDELNATNATENVEDICVDGEQVKKLNLEESWEFEQPIPDWLKRIHQHRENLATTTDATDIESLSQVAETAIWWHIIDTCDPKLTNIITEQEFLNLSESLLSNLPSDWEVLELP